MNKVINKAVVFERRVSELLWFLARKWYKEEKTEGFNFWFQLKLSSEQVDRMLLKPIFSLSQRRLDNQNDILISVRLCARANYVTMNYRSLCFYCQLLSQYSRHDDDRNSARATIDAMQLARTHANHVASTISLISTDLWIIFTEHRCLHSSVKQQR